MKIPNINKELPLFVVGLTLGLSLFEFSPTFVITQRLFYLLISLFIFQHLASIFRNMSKRLSKVASILLWIVRGLFAAYLVLYLFGSMLTAQWGIIDDHEIVSYLGPDRSMSLLEIPSKLQQTEVGKFGESLRYRPSYYTLRLLETAAWGWHPQVWYAARLLSLVGALLIGWYLLEKVSDFSTSGIFLTFILMSPFWSDLFNRLGPSETYGVIFLMTYILSFVLLFNTRDYKYLKFSFIIHLISLSLLFGIKENFLLLALPESILIWRMWRSKKVPMYFFALLAAVFIYGFAIFISLALAIGKDNVDIYANSVDASQRFSLLSGLLKYNDFQLLVTICAVLFALTGFMYWMKLKQPFKTAAARALAVLISCTLIFVSQYIFYNGQWPNNTRYDFPGMLVIPIAYFTVFIFSFSILRLYKISPYLVGGIKHGVLLGLCLYIVMNAGQTFGKTRDLSARASESTQIFTENIDSIVLDSKKQPHQPIVFESSETGDYEPMISTALYLKANGVTNNIHLVLNNYEEYTKEDGLTRILALQLTDIQRQGSPLFSAGLPLTTDCIGIVYSGSKTNSCLTQLEEP